METSRASDYLMKVCLPVANETLGFDFLVGTAMFAPVAKLMVLVFMAVTLLPSLTFSIA